MCHQSVSLTARHLEQAGIATVIIGSAMDIVTHCSVPRYLHNDLPLGNPLGPPQDRETQRASVTDALRQVATSTRPCVAVSKASWPYKGDWKNTYNKVDDSNRLMLEKLGEENRRKRAQDKAAGLIRNP